ncbi:hypothetical protein GBA52_000821 [Prunus armeniaca]|nr:hypothetical protein GBA52_000821 [Prunus armeniaca]
MHHTTWEAHERNIDIDIDIIKYQISYLNMYSMVCYIIGIWKGDMNPSDNITTKAKKQGSSSVIPNNVPRKD